MKRYDEKILNILLDKYENSLLYTGQNQRNQSISFSVKRSTLPEYFEETSMQFELVHSQLAELEQKGFVELIWQKGKIGHILENVYCSQHMQKKFMRICIGNPEKRKKQRYFLCREYQGRHAVLDSFLDYIKERIAQRESVAQYVELDSPRQFASRCELIWHILENQNEIFLREFSVKHCSDSKIAEKEIAGAAGIIARFYPEEALAELTAEQVLEEFDIYRNPSLVMMKGCGSFQMKKRLQPDVGPDSRMDSCIFLADFPGGIGLSSRDIASICWDVSCSPKRIVTIENLTSFHRWQEERTLAIYLGGYHNRAKREFLQKLYRTFPNCSYEHFGDLDCGGFQIWKDLSEKTGIPFRTRYMDTETYLLFCENGKALTENDRKTLSRMIKEPFFEEQQDLFQTMLEVGKKVEQEGIMITADRVVK